MPTHLIKNMQMCSQFGGYQIQLIRKNIYFRTTFQLQSVCAFFTNSTETESGGFFQWSEIRHLTQGLSLTK